MTPTYSAFEKRATAAAIGAGARALGSRIPGFIAGAWGGATRAAGGAMRGIGQAAGKPSTSRWNTWGKGLVDRGQKMKDYGDKTLDSSRDMMWNLLKGKGGDAAAKTNAKALQNPSAPKGIWQSIKSKFGGGGPLTPQQLTQKSRQQASLAYNVADKARGVLATGVPVVATGAALGQIPYIGGALEAATYGPTGALISGATAAPGWIANQRRQGAAQAATATAKGLQSMSFLDRLGLAVGGNDRAVMEYLKRIPDPQVQAQVARAMGLMS